MLQKIIHSKLCAFFVFLSQLLFVYGVEELTALQGTSGE